MKVTSTIKTKKFFKESIKEFKIIDDRKILLDSIAQFIKSERKESHKVRLNFICTHNSRRSQLAQVWAHYAISYYKLKKIRSCSGGTEVTAFHKNTVQTLQYVGFDFTLHYRVHACFSNDARSLLISTGFLFLGTPKYQLLLSVAHFSSAAYLQFLRASLLVLLLLLWLLYWFPFCCLPFDTHFRILGIFLR